MQWQKRRSCRAARRGSTTNDTASASLLPLQLEITKKMEQFGFISSVMSYSQYHDVQISGPGKVRLIAVPDKNKEGDISGLEVLYEKEMTETDVPILFKWGIVNENASPACVHTIDVYHRIPIEGDAEEEEYTGDDDDVWAKDAYYRRVEAKEKERLKRFPKESIYKGVGRFSKQNLFVQYDDTQQKMKIRPWEYVDH